MNPLSEELKKERESKGITLAEIAKKTRINIKYLEAIEQGAFDILPQTYVRAFIKTYADSVGLNPNQMLHKYEVYVVQRYTDDVSTQSSEQLSGLHPHVTDEMLARQKKTRNIFMGIGITAVLVLLAFFLADYFDRNTPRETVEETSFQDVIKEHDPKDASHTFKPAVTAIDTADSTKILPQVQQEVFPDSLVLRVVASDSVWLTIVRDNLLPRRGYLLNGRYRTYVAKKEFTVTVSDAGAIKLYLNGIQLPPIGTKGKPAHRIKITADDLKR